MRIIKALPLVIIIMALLAAPVWAGPSYKNTIAVELTGIDSSATQETETDSLTSCGTTGAPIFYWGNLAEAGVNSFIAMGEAYITKLDTDDAASQIADTSASDTIYIILYTAWYSLLGSNSSGYARANETVLDTIILANMTLTAAGCDRAVVTIPSTTALGDAVYARIKKVANPKNNDDTTAIYYNVGISMRQ